MKSINILVLLVVVAGVLSPATATPEGSEQPTASEWTPIPDPSISSVVAVGEFAVGKHNEWAGTNLVFKSVVKGHRRSLNDGLGRGTDFTLTLEAEDGGTDGLYRAGVWVDAAGNHRKTLKYFRAAADLRPSV